MWYLLEAFERFDPLVDEVPDDPFPALPRIVEMALRLLRGRFGDELTVESLQRLAAAADSLISEFFRIEAEVTHGSAVDAGGLRRYGYYNPDNTPLLEALGERIYSQDEVEIEGVGPALGIDLVAVLGLFHIEETLDLLQFEKEAGKSAVEGLPQFVKRPKLWYRTRAANNVVLAVEAITLAVEREGHRELLEEIDEEHAALMVKIKGEGGAHADVALRIARELVSASTRKAAAVRHKENRAMKQEVFAWCDAHMRDYKSMDDAALFVAGKLVPIKFRAVRSWMTEWRKQRSARTA